VLTGISELQLQHVIVAIGGLGTAAFGLVDAAKSTCKCINRIGFRKIKDVAVGLVPEGDGAGKSLNALPQANILATLEANWANGVDLSSQKAIAKSLIKLHLNVESAEKVAAKTNVDPAILKSVAAKISSGTALSQPESDAYARLDLIVTALLDEAYQFADEVYRNRTRALAALLSVVLALTGTWCIDGTEKLFASRDLVTAVVVGLLATPLAPIAKDLSSALSAAVNALQIVKK
jgi:hypothetical protein